MYFKRKNLFTASLLYIAVTFTRRDINTAARDAGIVLLALVCVCVRACVCGLGESDAASVSSRRRSQFVPQLQRAPASSDAARPVRLWSERHVAGHTSPTTDSAQDLRLRRRLRSGHVSRQ